MPIIPCEVEPMKPNRECKLSKKYVIKELGQVITIKAGYYGWTIIYPD